jgi:predicted ATP-binding protein involved in virulence
MITSDNFPYITNIHVKDCYAVKDLEIPLKDHKPFSHLILTGKNGSGKTSILRVIDELMTSFLKWTKNIIEKNTDKSQSSDTVGKKIIDVGHLLFDALKKNQDIEKKIRVTFLKDDNFPEIKEDELKTFFYSFLATDRHTRIMANVENPSTDQDFWEAIDKDSPSSFFVNRFKQYLVNQKIAQAFAQINNNKKDVEERQSFLDNFQELLRKVLEDNALELIFEDKKYNFYIKLSDGRKQDFNTLSDGFSAFVSILMDLLIRVDLVRKQVEDFSYNPCGIVLIDEPETHLHLELQYQVLPILTTFFPNIQFIVATHSPAVISSIPNATIFDLTDRKVEEDEVAGKSYSDLMVSHFGLENEFSPIADNIFASVNATLKKYRNDKVHLKEKLQEIFDFNEKYLSAGMRLELESMIIENS